MFVCMHVKNHTGPSLSQGIVTEVEDELVQRVWLNLSHCFLLFPFRHHGGFLQAEPRKSRMPSAPISHTHTLLFFINDNT